MLREGSADLVDSGNVRQDQPSSCTAEPPCSGGQTCPHSCASETGIDGKSAEKVRAVAREVARVCTNLDLGLLETCYRTLYDGHRGDELLSEFVDAYHEELGWRRPEAQVNSSDS